MKLRFKDENGKNYLDWEKKKLGDIGDVKMNRRIFANETSSEFEIPFYKIGTFGKKADTYITFEKYLEYKERYPYPNIGDILISASGTIGKTVVYNGEKAYFQDSNIVWLDHGNKISNLFLNQFYNVVRWEGIEGTTIKRLYNSNILNTNINIPVSLEEQEKIGSFFKLQDEVIELKEKLIKEKREYKKGLLQKVFNQEVRFKDGTGNNYPDWEKKRLEEISSKESSNLTIKDVNGTGILPIYDANNIIGYLNDVNFSEKYISIIKDGAGVGRIRYIEEKSNVLGTMDKIINQNGTDIQFLFSLLNRIDFTRLISGSTIPHIYYKDYSKLSFSIPKSLEEQEKIGNLFKLIDEEIELLENEVIQLKQKKKYYLSVMM